MLIQRDTLSTPKPTAEQEEEAQMKVTQVLKMKKKEQKYALYEAFLRSELITAELKTLQKQYKSIEEAQEIFAGNLANLEEKQQKIDTVNATYQNILEEKLFAVEADNTKLTALKNTREGQLLAIEDDYARALAALKATQEERLRAVEAAHKEELALVNDASKTIQSRQETILCAAIDAGATNRMQGRAL